MTDKNSKLEKKFSDNFFWRGLARDIFPLVIAWTILYFLYIGPDTKNDRKASRIYKPKKDYIEELYETEIDSLKKGYSFGKKFLKDNYKTEIKTICAEQRKYVKELDKLNKIEKEVKEK